MKTTISNIAKKIWSAWSDFWFAPQGLLNLAVFRILLCGTLFGMYADRLRDVNLFYSDASLVPRATALQVIPEFLRPPFETFFWLDSQAVFFHSLLVIGLLLLTVGVGGRLLMLLVWVLHISFLQRNYSVAFGADLIGGIFLLYLAFTQSCERLSLWKLLNKASPLPCDTLSSVFYRMIQVQLCVIYAYTGMEKLKGGSWWDGTALWSVIANPQMVVGDMTWMRNFPYLIVLFTFSTVLFEVYFPVLVWNPKIRKALLAIGVMFHSGIGLLMALWSFALIMIAPYVLFLSEDNLESFQKRLRAYIRPQV